MERSEERDSAPGSGVRIVEANVLDPLEESEVWGRVQCHINERDHKLARSSGNPDLLLDVLRVVTVSGEQHDDGSARLDGLDYLVTEQSACLMVVLSEVGLDTECSGMVCEPKHPFAVRRGVA
jgi:hypothetical protein